MHPSQFDLSAQRNSRLQQTGPQLNHSRRNDSFESDECSDEEELARTAYHEAGHCVMAVLCGARACHASVSPEEESFFGQVDIQWPRSRSYMDEVAVILAGPVAEMIYRGEPLHPGFVPEWSLDWQQAWRLARPRAESDMKCLEMMERLIAKLHRSMSEDNVWSAIAAVQDLLLAYEDIEHEQIEYEVRSWVSR